jgi:hypothetical protein
MSDTPRTDVAEHNMGSVVEPHYVVDVEVAQGLERELVEAREQLRLCNVDQLTTAAELDEAQEELNDKRKFCYAVEQAIYDIKGDYVEIIKELRKDAERYRWLRGDKRGRSLSASSLEWTGNAELSDAAVDAAIRKGEKESLTVEARKPVPEFELIEKWEGE